MTFDRILKSAAALLWLPVISYAADGVDYTKGVFIVNEDWYGHQNSTVNYLLPDDPDGNWWHYRVVQTENPGMELGCTNQYGAIWNGRFYFIAKQAKDPGASVKGGRISVADASTMKLVAQLEQIDPSGAQCDGRAFVGVSAEKGYVSTSNGVWALDLNTLQITGQVEGSANPGTSLYYGQTGSMVLAEGRVFAVHQQYGVLVIDPETDRVVEVIDMAVVDDAVERTTGTRPATPAGVGSAIVRSIDGALWVNVAKDVQGTGDSLPYLVRIDPESLEVEVVAVEGDGVYPPSNSWYAWTPDPFCASSVTNTLYWCGGRSSWFTKDCIYRFDVDTRTTEKLVDLASEPGNWSVYGASLGIHPETDELYASLFHGFQDNTYIVRRFAADGTPLRDYPMISNYWFPSMPVFPQQKAGSGIGDATSVSEVSIAAVGGTLTVTGASGSELSVYNMQGQCVYRAAVITDHDRFEPQLTPDLYIVRVGTYTAKLLLN